MKRSEDFYSFGSKRPRLQQDVDDIWGDDPEIDEVDRCINLATQLCSQNTQHQQNNILNLTSYDDFKYKQNICSSTQAFLLPTAASTSGVIPKQENQLNSSIITIRSSSTDITKVASDEENPKLLQRIHSLESENKKLTEMYETKNGEITILRSKLNQAQKAMDSEKMEKLRIVQENQQKWNSKLAGANKELNSFKCELELKNLEIANLREKLSELKKVYNSNLNMTILNEELNATQVVITRNKINEAREPKKSTVQCKNIQTEINYYSYPITSVTDYPLQYLIPKSVFKKCQEKSTALQLKNINKNTLSSYKQNFTTLFGGNNAENSTKTEKNNLICLNNLYPDIQKLIRCTEEQLNNSTEVSNIIQNILNLTKNSLYWLLNQLNKINEKLSYDDVENMNSLYLEHNEIQYNSDCIFSGTLWHENETAVDIRRYLAILSSLVFHCQKLHNYFTTPANYLTVNQSDEIQMEVDTKSEYEFLNLLLEVTTIIKNIRRSEQFCGFLSAVLKLLGNLSSKETLPSESFDIIHQIFKLIIFSRPSKPVLKYACEFLKYISRHKLFIVKLYTLKKCESIQPSIKDGLLYFSEDSCAFRILSTELETCELSTEMASDVIQFLINSVTSNAFWMYHQEEQRCECLIGVYSLGINILFSTLKNNSEINPHIKDKTKLHLHHTIFQIGLIFLDILTARTPDLVVRCSRLLSQYQTIIKYISKIQKKLHLEKAHVTALENLLSQLNSDVQKQSQNKNIGSICNSSFTSF